MKWLEYYDKSGNKISDDFQPNLPIVTQEEYNTIIVPHLIKWGAIPKSQLKIGRKYKGYCRNSDVATWTGKRFEYLREKFGFTYIDVINHFEDDNGLDLFVPYEEI